MVLTGKLGLHATLFLCQILSSSIDFSGWYQQQNLASAVLQQKGICQLLTSLWLSAALTLIKSYIQGACILLKGEFSW